MKRSGIMRLFLLLLLILGSVPLSAGIRTANPVGQSDYVPDFPVLLENVDCIVISEAQGRDSYTPAKAVTDEAWITAFAMTLTASSPKPTSYCWCITNEHHTFFAGDKRVMKLMLKHKELALVNGLNDSGGQVVLGEETVNKLRKLLSQKRGASSNGKPPKIIDSSITLEKIEWLPAPESPVPVGSIEIPPIVLE